MIMDDYTRYDPPLNLWEVLFGRVEPSWTWEEIAKSMQEHRRKMALYYIKKQPFFK